MNYLKKLYQIENIIFGLFLGFVIYGSIRSTLIFDKGLFLFLIILVIAIIFLIKRNSTINKMLTRSFFKRKFNYFIPISLLCLFIAQLLLLTQISVPIGWDIFDNFYGITTSNQEYMKIVLSRNPNNQFFFFMMYYINKIINYLDVTGYLSNTWFSWQVINCLFIDVSLYFLYIAGKKLFNRSVGVIAYGLCFLSLGLSPWILTPYTDTMVLPFVCLTILLYSILKIKSQARRMYTSCFIIIIGILLTWCFLMKPSSIIFFIAYICITGIQLITETFNLNKLKICLFVVILLFLSSFGTYRLFHLFVEKQSITEIDNNMNKPWTLFVLMGMTGTGGYNDAQTQAVNKLPTVEEKKEYVDQQIKETMGQRNVLSYFKFLSVKNKANTANGDFGWGWDGGDLVPETESKNFVQSSLRNLYYPQTDQSKYLRFVMHFFYCITLFGMLFTVFFKTTSPLIAILKLTFIGMILYLLLFEGGRSRYLIQFMPFMYLLAANGIYDLIKIEK